MILLACAQDGADQDGDHLVDAVDCAPADATRYPGAPERCDGLDQDCDGAVDEDLPLSAWRLDGDGDGYGGETVEACGLLPGLVATSGDCDDARADVHPGAPEACDKVDQDCDGRLDDASSGSAWRDADSDGYGDPAAPLEICPASGAAAVAGDCDDTRASVFPGATERCAPAGVDDDCDGRVDDDDPDVVDAARWYLDDDGDGYGDPLDEPTLACDAPLDHVANDGDCDDAADWIHPLADEPACNHGVDHDCDGVAVDADIDGDGSTACDDCDDLRLLRYPGAVEVCDGIDNDCDEVVDDGLTVPTWYRDGDADGYGDPAVAVTRCDEPPEAVLVDGDCDDTRATVNPDATESCTTTYDDDCNGEWNEADARSCRTWWVDYDGDGYGNDDGASACLCGAQDPYTAPESAGEDCDETDPGIHPGALERCDGVDGDCDGGDGCTLGDLPLVLSGEEDELVGYLGAGDADIDGDGVSDVLVTRVDTTAGDGLVEAYTGPVTGTLGEPLAAWSSPASSSSTLSALLAHDADGDGYVDLFLADRGYSYSARDEYGLVARVDTPVRGNQGDLLSAAQGVWFGDGSTSYPLGWSLAWSDTILSDGPRLLAAASRFDAWTSGAVVLLDPTDVTETDAVTAADALIYGSSGYAVGTRVASGRDVGGDGVDDLLVGGTSSTWYVHEGPVGGVVPNSDASRRITLGTITHGALVPDVDDDGLADVLVESNGYLALFAYGTDTTLDSGDATALFDTDYGTTAGTPSLVLDLDQDGAQDLLTRRPAYDAAAGNEGEVVLFLGPFAGTLSVGDTLYRWTGTRASAYAGLALLPVDSGGERPSVLVSASEHLTVPTDGGALYLLEGASLP